MKDNTMFYLKKCEESDCDIVYEWANDSTTRANSFNTKSIVYEEHCNWFKASLKNKNRLMYIFYKEETPLGIVRLDKESEYEAEMSASIDKKFRGKGYSEILFDLAKEEAKLNKITRITASVKKGNAPSRNALLRKNYIEKVGNDFNEYYLDLGE